MLHFVLQTIAFQLFFLIIYDVFLKKETFFNWNRAYLLVTAILSIVLPFIKIQSFKDVVPNEFIVNLPQVIIGTLSPIETSIETETLTTTNSNLLISWENLFYLGLAIALILFLVKLFKIIVLIYSNPKYWSNNLRIVTLIKSNTAFSFFYYVFLGEQIKEDDRSTVLKHEIVHVKQKHTLDLLFFELLRIVFWFNPLVYMYQNRIASLHEFIADAEAVKFQNKNQYYQDLLSQIFETQNVSFINAFYKKSLIKKRIVMLSKTKSKQTQLVKYALLIPLVFGMLLYTSSFAQELNDTGIVPEVFIDQELTDKELQDKYYVEMLELYDSDNKDKIFNDAISHRENYLNTREEYYRFQANMKVMFDKMEHTYSGDKVSFKENLNRSYAEYLELKKTEVAKDIWENNSSDGVLRMVVNTLGNLKEEEKKEKEGKIQLMIRDDYFHALIVSDGLNFEKSTIEDHKVEKTPNEKITTTRISETQSQDPTEVPFAVIQDVPMLSICENLTTNDERKKCVSKAISNHVLKNFNTKLANDIKLVGKQRIAVVFKIDKQGNVFGVRSRAPHADLEAEAERVINLLPQFIPGKQKGKPVIVPYSLPIVFQVEEKKSNNKEILEVEEIKNKKELEEIPFAVIDEVPTYPGCENLTTEKERKKCMAENISKFVQKKFNTDLAKDKGLIGRQRINVIFKIDKEGNVVGVRSRAPHPKLEDEARRVIGLLPKMIPGKHEGKNVIVPYSLPIVFEVKDKSLPFAKVDKAPSLPQCETLLSAEEQRKCVANVVSKSVQKSFNADLPSKIGLKGKQRIISKFTINSEGNIVDIIVKAPHPDLEAETIRAIKLLPKFIPGEHEGEKVSVSYALPIVFMVAN